MQPQASGTGQPPEQDIGVRVSLSELIDIRHRVREVPLFSTPHRRSPLVGLHHSKLRGRGVDFDQVRVYQAGDDVRTIDWRVTARTQEPHTKLFHEERERPIYIVVEQSPRLFFGSGRQFKSVLAAQAAGLIGWAALSHNDRVGGLVFGSEQQEIKPRRSKQSLLQLLDRITRANRQLRPDSPLDPEAFSLALRRVREVLRPGSLSVILCDERTLSDAAEQQLSLLARCRSVVAASVGPPRSCIARSRAAALQPGQRTAGARHPRRYPAPTLPRAGRGAQRALAAPGRSPAGAADAARYPA